MMTQTFKIFAAFLAVCLSTSALLAQDAAVAKSTKRDRVLRAAERYVDDGTVVIGVADISEDWIDGMQKEVVKRLGGEVGNKIASNPGFAITKQLVMELKKAGAKEVMLIASTNHIKDDGGPIVVVTTENRDAGKQVKGLVGGLVEMITGNNEQTFPCVDDGRGNVVVGAKAIVEQQMLSIPAERPDLLGPLGQGVDKSLLSPGSSATVVLSPSSDTRRVLRELWPPMPRELKSITGTLLADDFKCLALDISSPPEWEVNAELVADSPAAAERWSKTLAKTYEVLVAQIAKHTPVAKSDAEQLAKMLEPKKGRDSLTITLRHDNKEAEELVRTVVIPAVHKARQSATRNIRMNHAKLIALAFMNFHDTQKHFPASRAIVDKDGKPLLSWRVAILPFIEQQALHDQFRLDEPWDSPHNLKLATTVPSVYIHPMFPQLAAEGKTVYQVPYHAQSVFPPLTKFEPEKKKWNVRDVLFAPGLQFRDITDGTSNTILVAEVAPEHAVIWTKPDDWEVDLNNPMAKLQGKDVDGTVVAFCDGSAHFFAPDMDKVLLRTRITRGQGDIPNTNP